MAPIASSSPKYQNARPLIILFIFIHTFVWTGSSIILLTVFFSKKIRRHGTWVNLKISWILACFSYALLFTTGQLFKSKPLFSICLAQAAAVYATPILTAGTAMALAVYLYLATSVSSKTDTARKVERGKMFALLGLPYVLPTVMFVFVLLIGLQDPNQVHLAANWQVCVIRNATAQTSSTLAVVIIMIPTLIIEGLAMVSVYKRRHLGLSIFGTMVRLIVFTAFGLFAVIVSFASMGMHSAYQTAVGNVLLSMAPLSYIVLFGLQKDILKAWAFWRRDEGEKEPKSVEGSSSSHV